MGDLIPFRPSGKDEFKEEFQKINMHLSKMEEAKSMDELNYHYNQVIYIFEKLRMKKKR
ncbi:hypothetical protein [Halobacillus litoralis]|uniref:hypothetical protein n=1 Tax=Halobacillus litoralis TaxID=45668 RepID=UPI0013E8BBA8|nr:hypothetical protein [Halobacillus litoralis]